MSNRESSEDFDKPAKGSSDERDPIVVSIRLELDRSCAALDGYTLSRLHRIRSEAVARRRSRLQQWLLPFGTLATASALVLAIGLYSRTPASGVDNAALEDIEILAANEALDFYADYEFYQWLAQN
jgi:hypothetical protein